MTRRVSFCMPAEENTVGMQALLKDCFGVIQKTYTDVKIVCTHEQFVGFLIERHKRGHKNMWINLNVREIEADPRVTMVTCDCSVGEPCPNSRKGQTVRIKPRQVPRRCKVPKKIEPQIPAGAHRADLNPKWTNFVPV